MPFLTIVAPVASGLPVVATRTGGNIELIDPGQCGQLVPPGEAAALADATAVYVRDDAIRIQHGKYAREQAKKMYSLDSMIRNYHRAYEKECTDIGAWQCAASQG